jgi:hypothetical protein
LQEHLRSWLGRFVISDAGVVILAVAIAVDVVAGLGFGQTVVDDIRGSLETWVIWTDFLI